MISIESYFKIEEAQGSLKKNTKKVVKSTENLVCMSISDFLCNGIITSRDSENLK